MRRDVLRFSRWVGFLLLFAVLVISGCTRAKSSGPPEPTTVEGTVQVQPTQPTGGEPTSPPLSGDDAINATTTAMAATATAESTTPEDTEVPPTDTPQPTEAATTEAPEVTDTPESTEVAQGPTPTAVPASERPQTHKVKAGENLFRIALQYNLTYQELAAYNGIANPNIIQVGRELKIPPAGGTAPPSGETYHVVKQGENLFRIALQYNMLFTQLAAANDLAYPYTIYPGQKLIIP